VNPSGVFQYGEFAPGAYKAYAFEDAALIEYRNPEVLNQYASKAVRVTLSAGEKTKVNLDLIPAGEGE
jgi:hypothetical protein